MAYPTTTNAGHHAWRRVHKAIGAGEAKNLAADIVAIIAVEINEIPATDITITESIRFALEGYPWEDKKRGD